jgi:hypothetical protein
MKKLLTYLLTAVLLLFGMITLFLSSSIFFDWFGIREKEGDYVLFVVIANFIASILYLIAGYGFLKNKLFTAKTLYLSIAVLVAAFAGLLVHVNSGGIYETKTIGAMAFRIILTSIFSIAAYLMINKKYNQGG